MCFYHSGDYDWSAEVSDWTEYLKLQGVGE